MAFDSENVAIAKVAFNNFPFFCDSDFLRVSWVVELQCVRQVEGCKDLEVETALEILPAACEHGKGDGDLESLLV